MCDGYPIRSEGVVAIAKIIVYRSDCGRDEVCVDNVANFWMVISGGDVNEDVDQPPGSVRRGDGDGDGERAATVGASMGRVVCDISWVLGSSSSRVCDIIPGRLRAT